VSERKRETKNLRERIECEKVKCMREKIDRFEIGSRVSRREGVTLCSRRESEKQNMSNGVRVS